MAEQNEQEAIEGRIYRVTQQDIEKIPEAVYVRSSGSTELFVSRRDKSAKPYFHVVTPTKRGLKVSEGTVNVLDITSGPLFAEHGNEDFYHKCMDLLEKAGL